MTPVTPGFAIGVGVAWLLVVVLATAAGGELERRKRLQDARRRLEAPSGPSQASRGR